MIDFNEELDGSSAIFKYNVDNGELINKYVVSKEQGNHWFGDLTIAYNGDVYVSDSHSNQIYRIKNESEEIGRGFGLIFKRNY